jgi:CDP-diacylglycerol--serine O-phosphatidyltransferase
MRNDGPSLALYALPTALTLGSVLCGFQAILLCLGQPDGARLSQAALYIALAMLFDIVDGRLARLTGTTSEFGVQIDSLADLSSFGVAPAVLAYRWGLEPLGALGVAGAFLYLACGAIRLARYNVKENAKKVREALDRQAERAVPPGAPDRYIVGLPIPGGAGVLVSVVVAAPRLGLDSPEPWALFGATVGTSVLMISTIPFRGLKSLRQDRLTYFWLLLALGGGALLALGGEPRVGLAWVLMAYVLISVGEAAVKALAARRP